LTLFGFYPTAHPHQHWLSNWNFERVHSSKRNKSKRQLQLHAQKIISGPIFIISDISSLRSRHTTIEMLFDNCSIFGHKLVYYKLAPLIYKNCIYLRKYNN
jgi:hypothetical protein